MNRVMVGDGFGRRVTPWLVLAVLLAGGCSRGPNASAQARLGEIESILAASTDRDTTYRQAYASYERASDKLNRLLADFPETDVARSLVAGNRQIAGHLIDEFHRQGASLEPLAQAEQSPLHCARLAAESLDGPWLQGTALIRIGKLHLHAGADAEAASLFEQGCVLCGKEDLAEMQEGAYWQIFRAYYDQNRTDEAAEWLRRFREFSRDTNSRLITLIDDGAIAIQYANRGRFDAALQAVEAVEPLSKRIEAWIAIAAEYRKQGQPDEADRLLDSALQTARAIDDPADRTDGMRSVAVEYHRLQRPEAAAELLGELAQYVEQLPAGPAKSLARRVAVVGYAWVQMCDAALDLADTIRDADERAMAICGVAIQLARTEQYERAFDVARQLGDGTENKGWFLYAAARQFAEAGQFDRALQMADEMEVGRHRDRVLDTMATALVAARQFDRASAVVDSIADEFTRESARRHVVDHYATIGDFDRAMALVDSLTDDSDRQLALVRIAEKCAEAGHVERAMAMARSFEWFSDRCQAMIAIASHLAVADDPPADKERLLTEIVQEVRPLTLPWR